MSKLIKYISENRFSLVDAVVIGLIGDSIIDGRYLDAFVIAFIGSVASTFLKDKYDA